GRGGMRPARSFDERSAPALPRGEDELGAGKIPAPLRLIQRSSTYSARLTPPTGGPMNETAIQVEGLAKRFGEVTALAGVDFQVPRATILGLLGPNGAGKTTAVRI